ncbi:HNH endonuclease signature motif containing protein [Pseudonocardia eucalypti]|uniref:HNH endonuclease signature motif containing protein n=1 Tax=Pseudonocardia eucalypti TaxID=648755 RepID=A0ABP9QGX4_9PSEU|nr:5-methylcytosine-specific restriction protein A [Pseudonocardia eucalypti]
MFESRVEEAAAAVAALRAYLATADGATKIEGLKAVERLIRDLSHLRLSEIADLDRSGEFDQRCVTTRAAIADLLGYHPQRARRMVAVARAVFPTTLDGQPVEPAMPATAAALGALTIDQPHADVIENLLNSPTGRRLDPGVWGGAEKQLAEWATTCRPDELRRLGTQLLNTLDQDGPEPEDEKPQLNELYLYRCRDGHGGRITGQLDTPTFTALSLALEGHRTSGNDDEDKSLPERDADALGALCVQALNQADLPVQGGERPHLTVIVQEKDLRERVRGATLGLGWATTAHIRQLACDCKVLPVVLDGDSTVVDVGRIRRTVDHYQRRAIAARDQGCAWRGCNRKPRHCEVHHIIPWAHGGRTDLNNLVMLCWAHHRMIHHAGWEIRIHNGWPEFTPPKWIDASQTPRRKPRTPLTA